MKTAAKSFSCGKVIGDKWEEFVSHVKAGENPREVLESLGITRYCCKRMMLSHIQNADQLTIDRSQLYQREDEKPKEEKEFGNSS